MEETPSIEGDHLKVARCPWCEIARPACPLLHRIVIQAKDRDFGLSLFHCAVCGGPIAVSAPPMLEKRGTIWDRIWRIAPTVEALGEGIPPKVEHFLNNARETLHAASASIMVSASAVDAMLKERGYTKGDLYPRIEEAATKGLLTADMKEWAHEVRLDANDERHADEGAGMPTVEDARRVYEFAETLAELLFILPARVRRGRKEATGKAEGKSTAAAVGETVDRKSVDI